MADSEEVLKELDPPDDVEIIGIVVNEKKVHSEPSRRTRYTLWDFRIRSRRPSCAKTRISPRKTRSTKWRRSRKADHAALDVVVYISMAFGNPYGDLWNVDEVMSHRHGVEQPAHYFPVMVGMATPEQVSELVGAVMAKYDYLEIGIHLHSRPEHAAAKVLAAYDAGCRRFDSAIGGLGAVRSRKMRWSATSRRSK